MSEVEQEIREWLEKATVVHKLEDGDLIIIQVDEPSVQAQRSLWGMFERALEQVNKATGKNVTVLFLAPGWDVEAIPRARARERLRELLRQTDDSMETCGACGKEYPKRDRRCPACGLKVRT